jgi:Putative restriction endonuclease
MTGKLINDQRLEDQTVEDQNIEDQTVEDQTVEDQNIDDIDDDLIVPELDISDLVIEDDTPVDNFQSAIQQRLLVEPLYSSKALPIPFLAAANIGLFYKYKTDPIVPDVMLSLGVQRAEDFADRRNRSYFLWEFGKLPEVCIEIISNREGDELKLSQKAKQRGKTHSKREIYAQIGVDYYVAFDPLEQIQGEDEMNGALLRVWEMTQNRYRELTLAEGITAVGQSVWLDRVGIGLTLWSGQFEEEQTWLWLRWCDQQGQVISTGAERAEAESQRAAAESQRAEQERQAKERLETYLRSQGIDPDQLPG